MKKFCMTLMAMVSMMLSGNLVAQTIGSVNEYGETIDEFGGIIAPPLGDTVKFRRVAGTAIYKLNGSTQISNPQRGSALMVICNDSVYYWKSPVSLMPESRYWIKGLCDKQAQTVTFEQGQVNYFNPDSTVSTLCWCVRDPQASPKYDIALDHADAFVFDIKGDTLALRDCEPFKSSTTEPAYFMGTNKGTTFTKYGDGATRLVRQYPVEARDTVKVTSMRLFDFYEGKDGDGYTGFASIADEFEHIQIVLNGDRNMGNFVTTGIDYHRIVLKFINGGQTSCYDGELNIFEDNEGYKMQGVLIGTDERAYQIDLIQPAGTYDLDAFIDLDITIPIDSVDIQVIGMGHFSLLAELKDYWAELELFADPSATVLPVGDYVISDTHSPGTALQSTGYYNQTPYPCSAVAVKYNSDGSIYTDNLWLFVSGTISVNADGSILAVGKNSYGRDIRISFSKEVRDSNNIIVEPATGTTIEYRRKVMSCSSFFKDSIKGGSWLSMQASNAIMVACEDGTVYWQDPVSHYRKGSWIKGKKEGSTITFPAKQPVFADADYLYTVRWGLQKGTKFAVADDYSEDIILDIVNDSLILRGSTYMDFNEDSEHYFIGIFKEKFSNPGTYSFCFNADSQTNLYIPSRWPDLNLITPPVGMVTEKLPYFAHDFSDVYGDMKDSVLVGWDNDTVYIQGLCPQLPDGWVKGTLQEGIVTFKASQYVGQYNLSDMWMFGGNMDEELTDYHLKYDVESNYFVGASDEVLVENAFGEWVIFNICAYNDITIGTSTPTGSKEPALRSARFSEKPIKTIENGQLRILRNDKRYTILGVGE